MEIDLYLYSSKHSLSFLSIVIFKRFALAKLLGEDLVCKLGFFRFGLDLPWHFASDEW